ncbi:MAG TPA: hypothetical protein DFS52_11425 [Myxococcales bacterium]|nr:hypothetical protein [Myxococcales bacterium]
MTCGNRHGHGCCCDHSHDTEACQNDGSWMGFMFNRRFQTKAEQTAELEAYLEELRAEVQAVEERLEDLKK